MTSRTTSPQPPGFFADDSLLYRRIRTEEDRRILQEDLSRLEAWEKDWQMSFNPIKCEVIRICKRRNQINGSYTIHGQQLATVKSGKYLGVILTDNLSWNAHVDQATKKANNSLAFLRRKLYSCPSHTKVQSYQTLVRPILEYASSAWDPYSRQNIDKLEAVQRCAARFVTGDYRTTSSVSDMIMPPTLKKLMGHIAFGACVSGCVGASHFLYLL